MEESVDAVGSFPTPYTTATLSKFSDADIAAMRVDQPAHIHNSMMIRATYGGKQLGMLWLPNGCTFDSTGSLAPYADNGGSNPLDRACGRSTLNGWMDTSNYWECEAITTFTTNGANGCHGGMGNWYQPGVSFNILGPTGWHIGTPAGGFMSDENPHWSPERYCVVHGNSSMGTFCDRVVDIEIFVV